jgi:hypothetical protein
MSQPLPTASFKGKVYNGSDGYSSKPFSVAANGGGQEARDKAMADADVRGAALAMIQAWASGPHDPEGRSPKQDQTQLVECAWVFINPNGVLGMVSEFNYMSPQVYSKISATHAKEGVDSVTKCAEDKLKSRHPNLLDSVLYSAAVNVHGGEGTKTSKPIPACSKCSDMLGGHGIVDIFSHLR